MTTVTGLQRISIVIPARNEAGALRVLLPELINLAGGAEILVINDGSTDATVEVCNAYPIRVVSHLYPMGNGAAIKTGARAATGEILIFMDADGQHKPEDIPALLEKFEEGYDMVVGARQSGSHAGAHRAVANDVFSRLATWMVRQSVEDLTSGFRVVKANKFRKFLYLLPNGFSYPTTITMSFFRAGLSVAYVPIHTPRRASGKSHIQPARDGLRFLLIIFKIGTLYSPLKLFLPMSLSFFFTGFGYYLYTYLTEHRFTNMSALLFITSTLVFLIGLISEQITMLIYKDSEH
ncbi:glycosyltransferase family 2 protein [Sulfurirhabdus autotrophica]|uniref:Glycosyltransferase involved in cell wall biosynthesis n=1 Tax=Sulfurirhabdus autotrophica TaxID=1706046 RepID=A0A4R3XUG5_9PROT|nr:glycosyltransferase family 2 protein [Sulfurirhabdus autotrophica]TCV79097.1 glycosyltransferase involved in cell wall biosynthesis [Sulfurirhabdus autotrophica]